MACDIASVMFHTPAGDLYVTGNKTRMSDDVLSHSRPDTEPVAFLPSLAGSESFKAMFREGMVLVEETATYLDGQGRRDSSSLSRTVSLAYATESMRLTTRLMQLASWLLLQRAVCDGEMAREHAVKERQKVKIGGVATSTEEGATWDALPERLKDLIGRSLRLQERIRRLDAAFYVHDVDAVPANPVARDLGRIAEAFAGRRA